MEQPIVNRVAGSGIITIDLSDYIPHPDAVVELDIKPYLFREMILKEKDFREALKNKDWTEYANKHVALICSADAIIPVWAYMLLTSYLQPVAKSVWLGSKEEKIKHIIQEKINSIKASDYEGKRIVIKGCGDHPVPDFAYTSISHKLLPVVRSLMYGEPCSMVPIYKRK